MMKAKTPLLQRIRLRLSGLREDSSGLALAEFAYTMPIVLSLGMMGAETANYSVTHMRISQVAMQVADNASRAGTSEIVQLQRVSEKDINDVFIGAWKLGAGLEVLNNGRIILSSLQRNSDDGQWIAWQRCKGVANFSSSYGDEGDGSSGTDFPGMGDEGEEIQASGGTAVMFVEVIYDYEGLTPFDDFITGDTIRYTSAFNIRDNRDLSGLNNDSPNEIDEDDFSTCDKYDSF